MQSKSSTTRDVAGVETMPPKIARRSLRRPAASKAVMKRPGRKEPPKEEEEIHQGKVQKFRDVDPRMPSKMGAVVLQDASYYGRTAPKAGHFNGINSEGDQHDVKLKTTGTKHEELLGLLGGREDCLVNVHMCEEGVHGPIDG